MASALPSTPVRRRYRQRYQRILWFFGGVLLHVIWWDLVLPKIGLGGRSRRTRPARLQRIAARFRVLAVQMGGVMIKVGQFLSARLDVLPRAITDELIGLQDEVQPESFADVRAVLESEMQATLEEKYLFFDPLPLASASIGQVHRAQIQFAAFAATPHQPAGDPAAVHVVVKVQRPHIQEIVETDLAALRVVTGWIQRYPPIRRRLNVTALMEEFSRSLYEEMDYLAEAKNGETFAANFAGQPAVRVPRIDWSHTTRRVLTMEEIRAIKISEYAHISAAGIERAEVANRLFDTYLKQIFEDRFFHADPHPGNLFVLPQPPDGESSPDWQLVFVDFGMIGQVPPRLLNGLREILISVGTQDVGRMVRAYQSMEILLPGADLDLLEKAGQRVFDRFWGKSTTEMVSMGQQEAMAFAHEFGDLLYEMPFQVPENLILLGRSVSILSGICSGLNPDFNIWERVMPYASRLVSAEQGGQKVWLREGLAILQSLVLLPRRTEAVLQRIEQGRLEVQLPELRGQIHKLDGAIRRLSGAILSAALFLGAVQLSLAGETTLAWASIAGAALAALWMIAGR